MRLHHLEATAFGPFAGTVRVDFDALSEAGLFLLTGPTGSGKSSVLDAVCFALYGDVPGDRGTARQLRSDRAADGMAPRVVLDCTLAGRRLRVTRSPAWSRPKKRGAGTTQEQAHVVVTERRRGSWEPLTTRLDEAGHLLGELLGMTLGQFTQVAMLPQGGFQAFLRARADERQKVLEQLFRTRRFRDVEEWLAERRRALGRSSREQQHRVEVLLSRVAEACGEDPPETWYDDGLAAAADAGEVVAWVTTHRDRTATARTEADAALATTEAALQAAAAESRAGADLADRQRRHRAASAEQESLTAAEPEQQRHRERLAADARATPLLPLLDLCADTARRVDRCREHAAATTAAARTSAGALLDVPDRAAHRGDDEREAALVDDWQRQATQRAAEARALLPEEERADRLEAEAARRRAEHAEATAALEPVEKKLAELPALLEAARTAAADAEVARAALPGLTATEERLARQCDAARELAPLEGELQDARAAASEAVEHLQSLREAWLEVKEERLAGMAAEIAHALAVGDDCPVCGSIEHPRPARPRSGAPDAAAERTARARVDDAEVARLAADERVRGLQTRVALARQAAGDTTPDRLARDLDEAQAARADAAARASALERLTADRRDLEARTTDTEREARRLRERRDGLARDVRGAEERSAEVRARVADLLRATGRGDGTTLADLVRGLDDVAARCEAAREARAALGRVHDEAASAARRAASAAEEAGFADPDRAREATLTAAERTRLERAVREHDRRVAVVTAALEDADLAAAAREPAPDLAGLRATEERARAEHARAEHRVRSLARVADRLAELGGAVAGELESWAPLREDLARTASLASFAEGRSPDNRLQMRLSAYVLGFRLGQVVEAANERLAVMTGERYALEHTGGKGAGDRRGGLGLLVRDAWSGRTRDPATLSGGETFVVSLALALGLSDVITQEAAGARLDTLFVDEGFGSLDPETLEDVLDVLDRLREGGRVVGVVSHVAEMADRIPARLVVRSSRTGSTLELAGVG